MPERVPESAIKFYEDRLVTQFRAADEQLARTPYLAGGEITVADLGLYPIYAGRKALIDGAGLKNVTAWGERVGARPGMQRGMRLEGELTPWSTARGPRDAMGRAAKKWQLRRCI